MWASGLFVHYHIISSFELKTRDVTGVNETRLSQACLEEILKMEPLIACKMRKGRKEIGGVGTAILCDNFVIVVFTMYENMRLRRICPTVILICNWSQCVHGMRCSMFRSLRILSRIVPLRGNEGPRANVQISYFQNPDELR